MPGMKTISFVDRKYGSVFRSSAVFYYRNDGNIRTTISFLDYWKFKRDLTVAAIASVRDMDGNLLSRTQIDFGNGAVINFRPAADSVIEGSIEIEIFSTKNMVIPYAAVVAAYESRRGLSLVHSYGRHYYPHEIEEGKTITHGREGCWTLRDAAGVRSFCVFHNGGGTYPEQTARLSVANDGGEIREAEIRLPALKPYQTVSLCPREHIRDLVSFLGGGCGHASLRFEVCNSFTRMLIGNEQVNGDDFQVTHSNFDYRQHGTDLVDAAEQVAYMVVPAMKGQRRRLIVYPQSFPGAYEVSNPGSGFHRKFQSGEPLFADVAEGTQTFRFRRLDGPFPTRLVTAIELRQRDGLLPTECSLGVLTVLQPRKRYWWGICSATEVDSLLVLHDLKEIYGGIAPNDKLEIALYSSRSREPARVSLTADRLAEFERGIPFSEVFRNAAEHLDGDYGYFTLFHQYGGLTAYTLASRPSGSLSFEHGF